jgi:hypoxanthine phosphoribosyltransferase
VSLPAAPGTVEELKEVLLTEEQIRRRVGELGAEISRDYRGRDLLLVTLLKGGIYFLADLSRALTVPAAIDLMAISSYSADSASGVARLLKDLDEEITGRHVILVEDIIDTGLTAAYLLRVLRTRNPASLTICTLLDKTARRLVPTLPLRYRGFEIPDVFVVGYGLDFRQQYRHLPYIAVLRDEPEASFPR